MRIPITLGTLFLSSSGNEDMYIYDTTPGSAHLYQTAVEVEIWEGYLLKNKSNIARTLCTYSLDNGPILEGEDGKLVFRFTMFDWTKNIECLLTQSNIHYNVIRNLEVNPLEQLLKKKILIADDDPDIAYCLSSVLSDAGYHVRTAPGGRSIMDGNYSCVDVFILDKQMPDIDGVQLCRHIRSQAATKETPVIMMSAQPQSCNEALLAGANAYVEKPFNLHYLLNMIARLTRIVPA